MSANELDEHFQKFPDINVLGYCVIMGHFGYRGQITQMEYALRQPYHISFFLMNIYEPRAKCGCEELRPMLLLPCLGMRSTSFLNKRPRI